MGGKMRDGIIFYKSFYESITELSSESALKIYDAIFKYAFYDEVSELVGIEKAIFALIQPQLDANNKKYENGKRGGRPKKNETSGLGTENPRLKGAETTKEENENHRFDKDETIGFEDKEPKEKEKEKENDKDNEKEKDIYCAELDEPDTALQPVLQLPLNDSSQYPIYQSDIDMWQGLYLSVDVLQQLRAMVGWLDANPTRRKTKKGIKRFVANWLDREQNKGRMRNNGANAGNDYGMSYQPWD